MTAHTHVTGTGKGWSVIRSQSLFTFRESMSPVWIGAIQQVGAPSIKYRTVEFGNVGFVCWWLLVWFLIGGCFGRTLSEDLGYRLRWFINNLFPSDYEPIFEPWYFSLVEGSVVVICYIIIFGGLFGITTSGGKRGLLSAL